MIDAGITDVFVMQVTDLTSSVFDFQLAILVSGQEAFNLSKIHFGLSMP
jgi:hypothetical protein